MGDRLGFGEGEVKGLLVAPILSDIAGGEGVDDDRARMHGFAASYDVPNNYGRFAQQPKPFTQMTLGEVDELQTRVLSHPDNKLDASPTGRYQVVRKTLRDLKAELDLNENVIFNAALQDRLTTRLLEKRGVRDFAEGKITEREFQERLAGEWASIENPKTGRAAQGQPLGTTTSQILPLIRALRKN